MRNGFDAIGGVGGLIAGCMLVALLAGCGGQPKAVKQTTAANSSVSKTAEETKSPAERLTASQALKRLLQTYRQAKSYSDEAVLRITGKGGGIVEEAPAAVKLERPNKLAVRAFQATICCDGKEFLAKIDDPPTNNIDGQFLARPAPAEIKLVDIAADPLLYGILSSRLQRQPIQLELLLESSGLATAFNDDVACNLLADDKAADRDCYRVEVSSPGGAYIFWIDQRDFLLRKLELPRADFLTPGQAETTQDPLHVTLEFTGAQVNTAIPPAEFVLSPPTGAKRMKSFVVPPRPAPRSTALLGEKPPPFSFQTPAGEKWKPADAAGKIAVICWFRNHPACQPALAQMELLRVDLADNPRVSLLAVSTDPTTSSDEDLAKLLAEWQVQLPLARDLEAFGDTVFKIENQPTIVVLNGEGAVQLVQEGASPDLARQLSLVVERLLKGDNLAEEIRQRIKMEREEYDKLVATGGPELRPPVEIPEAVIRSRSEPKTLKLMELWTNRTLKSPGNVYVIQGAAEKPRILVMEGWRTVTELDLQGQLVARHSLELPEGAAITYLRTAVDRAGKRFYLASAPLAPQLFLFDENWKPLRAVPAAGAQPARLADAQLADLGGPDGLAIYAGYLDLAGLQMISLQGERLRRSRSFPNVTSIAITGPDEAGKRRLLLTGDAGGVLALNDDAAEERQKTFDKWAIVRIAAAQFDGAKQSAYLAVAADPAGKSYLLALDPQLKYRWSYPLPAGAHQKPIEPLASANLQNVRAGEWVFAGPDGSLHLISEEGDFHDFFYCGAALQGVAAARWEDRGIIFASTEEGVFAWELK